MRSPCRSLSVGLAISLCLSAFPASAARQILDCDLCIYGATSGGVIAAAQAVRHGLKIVLIDPGSHVGGMSSGGLGATDKGNVDSIGGLSSEFYLRIARKYNPTATTRKFLFEPKVASAVFNDLLTSAAVTPLLNEPLSTVRKSGTTIREIETSTGLVVRAGMYLDTTYEGDLLAAAGINFRLGRESNATHNETKNGVLTPSTSIFVNLEIDPYLVPGNAASGLIPGISPGPPAVPGTADSLVQAYNYRLCLTQASNRLPIPAPPDYHASDYELIGRFLAAKAATGGAVDLASFTNGIFHNIGTADGMPNGKSDWNSNKGMSSDWIGHSHEWATASYARRAEIAREHENYTRGIFEFLRTDPRVPAQIKTELATWGLPADEYGGNGHWSPQLYVREARRMVGDYILTEANGRGTSVAPKSIALASYAMDSHYCQRVVVSGKTHAEGGFFELPPKPWPIGLGAITPRAGECTNLLATFALSASHVAFSSARMEPVFMMTSHSAATAGAIALRQQLPVQSISYPELSTLLQSDGQILEWATATTGNGLIVEAEGPGGNPQPASGSWTVSSSNAGFSGSGYLYASSSNSITRYCTFSPSLPAAGTYRVLLSWVQSSNRATNTKVAITHSAGVENLTVNQKLDPDGIAPEGGWKDVGTWTFAAGTAPLIRLDATGTDGLVIADAVRLEPTGTLVLPATVNIAAHDAVTSESGGNPARIIFRREGLLTGALTIYIASTGTATPGADGTALPSSIVFAAGSAQTSLAVSATADTLVEGPESLVVSLSPGSGYTPGPAGAATITLEDNRYDAWRFATFSPPQNADPIISGPTSDPDQDGLSNHIESITGGNPFSAGDAPPLTIVPQGSQLILTLRRSRSAAEAPIVIQSSPDLVTWPAETGAILTKTTETPDGMTREECWTRPATESRRYFRLNL